MSSLCPLTWALGPGLCACVIVLIILVNAQCVLCLCLCFAFMKMFFMFVFELFSIVRTFFRLCKLSGTSPLWRRPRSAVAAADAVCGPHRMGMRCDAKTLSFRPPRRAARSQIFSPKITPFCEFPVNPERTLTIFPIRPKFSVYSTTYPQLPQKVI